MRKTMTMLFLVLLLLNTIIPVYANSGDFIIKRADVTEKTIIDNTIEPMSPAIHPCHSGKTHAMYYTVIEYTEKCGCGLHSVECCCDRIMAVVRDYCEKHQPMN